MVQKIFIPKKGKYTYPLVVLFDPPVRSSYIKLIDSDGNEFQDGKLEGRRSSEISVFLYRPMKLIETKSGVIKQPHLKIGDVVKCKIKVIDSKGEACESEGDVLVETDIIKVESEEEDTVEE